MMRPQLRAFMCGKAARMAWKRGREVDRDHRVPFLERKLLDRRHVLDAGVVHEDVDAA